MPLEVMWALFKFPPTPTPREFQSGTMRVFKNLNPLLPLRNGSCCKYVE